MRTFSAITPLRRKDSGDEKKALRLRKVTRRTPLSMVRPADPARRAIRVAAARRRNRGHLSGSSAEIAVLEEPRTGPCNSCRSSQRKKPRMPS